jgi:hypothetical protein
MGLMWWVMSTDWQWKEMYGLELSWRKEAVEKVID